MLSGSDEIPWSRSMASLIKQAEELVLLKRQSPSWVSPKKVSFDIERTIALSNNHPSLHHGWKDKSDIYLKPSAVPLKSRMKPDSASQKSRSFDHLKEFDVFLAKSQERSKDECNNEKDALEALFCGEVEPNTQRFTENTGQYAGEMGALLVYYISLGFPEFLVVFGIETFGVHQQNRIDDYLWLCRQITSNLQILEPSHLKKISYYFKTNMHDPSRTLMFLKSKKTLHAMGFDSAEITQTLMESEYNTELALERLLKPK